MRHDLTTIQVQAVMAALHDAFDDDERLKLDTLEGETDLFPLLARLLDRIEEEDGTVAALASQIDDRRVRKDRAAKRKDAYREAITGLMGAAELDKLTIPEATLSVRMTAAKLVVSDPAAVPDEYTIAKPVPSMDAIKAAFAPDNDNLPNWLRTEPARPSLTVRRK